MSQNVLVGVVVAGLVALGGISETAGAQDWLRMEKPLSETINRRGGTVVAVTPAPARVPVTALPAAPDPVITGSHRRANRPGLLQTLFGGGAPADVQRNQAGVSRSEPHAAQPTRRRSPQRRSTRKTQTVKRTIAPEYLPAVVTYSSDHSPGTIIIDTSSKYLFLVMEGGQARRYGVGVGRPGFAWSGTANVGRKAEWPAWRPPAAMRKRQPELPTFMEGGPSNPLGARAMYLYKGGNDTLYRIHGSNEPWTIGHAVSSGCIRMRNEDVTELYSMVNIGTTVVVL